MNEANFVICSNVEIAQDVYKIVLAGDTSEITKPGQFVNVKIEGFYLRRPISVCDYDKTKLTLIYKLVGNGTDALSKMRQGNLNILCGLGNGYDTSVSGNNPVLIGGGVGVPPMYNLAKKLIEEGKKVTVILGFNKENEVFYEKEFKSLGCLTFVTTVDGSYGTKGFVTDVLKNLKYTYFYTCGPLPMFKAIEKVAKTSGQYSFEERMGCGFGACMGCSIKTKKGTKRICHDGPVLEREEIIW